MDQFGGITGDEALRNAAANLPALRQALEVPSTETSGMDDLVTWLRAQLDEDERVARSATSAPWTAKRADRSVYAQETSVVMGGHDGGWYVVPCDMESGEGAESGDAQHIARWDPARVLAEVEAKRRILGLWSDGADFPDFSGGYQAAAEDAISAMAQPYAGREGWREEWAATR